MVLSFCIPLSVCLDTYSGVSCIIAFGIGGVSLLRWAYTGLSQDGGHLIVRNFFRTRSVNTDQVASAQFRSRMLSRLYRLELCVASGECLKVHGVSLWLEGPRLPWQRPYRRLEEVERFFEATGLHDIYRSPNAR